MVLVDTEERFDWIEGIVHLLTDDLACFRAR